jgi:hypothetical protein
VNKPEAAAQLLDKAAKILEKTRPEDAIGMNTFTPSQTAIVLCVPDQ